MAGDHGALKIDPAIERWAAMRDNLWKGFRMTPYAAPRVTLWLGVVPLALGALATVLDTKIDWNGKRKGESLFREAHKTPTTVE
ncbi:transmembrane protein, putative, partial [Rhizoctonia solani AG-3 Rhs1AP]